VTMRFKHIAIVGVGLVGGSFALAARRAGLAQRITGWDTKPVLDEALARGVIDGVEDSFDKGGDCAADLVYLAAPVGVIMSFLRKRGNSCKAGAIVTDAGSTKREICRVARETLPASVKFVGGHPMAGSHRGGVEHADAGLFRSAPYALIAEGAVDESSGALRLVEDVVRSIGARPVIVTAADHDRTVARVSHAPQLLATALACAVARRRNEADLALAGGGFSEMVRLAASRWSMWEDICRTNADEITLALDEVISEMEAARASIASGDFEGMGAAFGEANTFAVGTGRDENLERPLTDQE
jgi:prephenate dehydrogenase